MHDSHQPEFRIGGRLGLQIDRLYIQHGVVNRDGDNIPADHIGSTLTPEGELAGEVTVLINFCLHLLCTQNTLILGKLVGNKLPVVFRVACSGDPSNQDLPVFWGIGHHNYKLSLIGAGSFPHHVVGLYILYIVIVLLSSRYPQVLLVIEHIRIGHVVFCIDLPLG